jgi:hypothetical protein
MTADKGLAVTVTLKQIIVPQCDAGAPSPVVMADEQTLVFGYYEAADNNPFETSVIVTVPSCSIFKFGAPNDEVLSGHRYAQAGLGYYSAYQVLESEWIRELTMANRVHPKHDDSLFDSLRHFIFTFHDSTLEFITRDDLTIHRVRGAVRPQVLRAFEQNSF